MDKITYALRVKGAEIDHGEIDWPLTKLQLTKMGQKLYVGDSHIHFVVEQETYFVMLGYPDRMTEKRVYLLKNDDVIMSSPFVPFEASQSREKIISDDDEKHGENGIKTFERKK
ncbi:MAG: hypothetical protein UT66_C0012G0032 [candidate division CPR2 bacterium GW2011_GWC1_39_9]|uniref:Uncharacterized protein n=1 Tax=candidate division CPR2 bacterium GW2011_GWC2_39_10 TaxID=1618345 RepID=A0A0G0P853_UNCC2|nr:MAG: hypothetical protein UT18_C0011G0005 [candidate division CPR2 bacterium GW2011_GWC2_39_10]KKR35191.1 MAG: hypothetical protein UT66_C0012G0032 [candidate division CPR2 bacterium GW2011_GWC1_39_9]